MAKKKLSKWNRHVRKVMKAGGTMKQASRTYKKNSWPRQSLRHAKAAVKGHGGRRGGKGTGRYSAKQIRRVKGNPAKKSKAFYRKIGKMGAAARWGKGRMGKKTKRNILTRYVNNAPKRSKAFYRKIGRMGAKARWGRKAKRNILTNMRYVNNPQLGFVESLKEVFSLETLTEGLQVAGGSIGAVMVPNLILSYEPVAKITPDFLKRGVGNYAVSLAASGLLGATVAWLTGNSKLGRNLMLGGVAGTLGRVVTDQVARVAKTAPAGSVTAKLADSMGLAQYDADVESAVSQAVEEELARQGIGDYLTPEEAGMGDYLSVDELDGMGDYLTPAEAGMGMLPGADEQDEDIVAP